MATDALSYTGINRAYSDYAGSRACEELINLRPATEGVVPVKDFSVKIADTNYRRIFVHHSTSGNHIIGIRGTAADHVIIEWVRENDTPVELVNLALLNQGEVDDVIEGTSYASAGNIILFSVHDTIFENHAFVWKENSYQEMEADVPEISYEVKDNNTESGATSDIYGIWQDIAHLSVDSSASECVDAVQNGLNAIQEQYPDICLGPIIIAVAFKTMDGSTFWTGNWRVYDPIPTVIADPDTPYKDATSEPSPVYAPFFNKYGFGYLAGLTPSGGDYLGSMFAYGTKVRLEFSTISGWHEDTSIIQSLEVYCSRPQVYLDAKGASDGLFKLGPGPLGETDYHLYLPQVKYEDMDLGWQLLYHQASIPMSTLAGSAQVINLTFGGNVQVTEDTLDADAGALKRYGRLLSYNARFHYWDSVAQITVGNASFNFPESDGSTTTGNVLAKYQDDDGEHLLCIGELENWAYSYDIADSAYFVIAPSINIKEIILYAKVGGGYYEQKYRMEASTTYNYSICVGGAYSAQHGLSGSNSEYDQAIVRASYDGYGAISVREPDAINVTEQYNPFVFRVEHSYKAPGNILDVQPQMAGIVDTSYGRDPLNVFTETGTYALTQGSADVLYGAFLPISNNVISSKGGGASLPTDMGIFFLGDGSLWLLVGRRPQLISDALHLGPHKYIRASDGYKRISGVDEDYSPAPAGVTIVPEYDVSDLLSQVTFEEFVRTGGRLSFNRFRMELMVSNKLYPYTYVLSLKYRQWFKIGKCVWQDEQGSNLINTPGSITGRMNVLDLSTEQSTAQVLVHMQTRPFSMGYRYIHMHRIVSMVRAGLSRTAGDKLVVGLYGSDDLQNWKLLAYSKRPGLLDSDPLRFSQIRTTSCARSWRYYTVCIGGPVPPDTDLGPVLVDYKPVIRRIG